MSFSITLFGPRHIWWDCKSKRVWFYQPDEHSTGGIGFRLPGLHVVFTWGRKKRGN
jgi:hypothetical protein